MHIRIFLALLGVLVISCVQKEETVLYIESNLPSNVQIAFESKLPDYYIKLLNVRYDVVTQYPYIRMTRKDRSKTYRLTRFPGKSWQAFHTKNENIYALLDHVIEGPGHVFHIMKISNNGDIQHVGDIKKNYYFQSYPSLTISGHLKLK